MQKRSSKTNNVPCCSNHNKKVALKTLKTNKLYLLVFQPVVNAGRRGRGLTSGSTVDETLVSLRCIGQKSRSNLQNNNSAMLGTVVFVSQECLYYNLGA